VRLLVVVDGARLIELHVVWLDERLRGQGTGRELLARVEREARARGCALAHLKTYHFQARGFYEKCGYRVVGQLDGYPPDGAMFWMAKELA
jgi:GNAT superfamily N-acetyltransferase